MTYADAIIISGERDASGAALAFINDYPLTHKIHHSPTGFNVGYAGSGPADLALSILAAVIVEPETEKIFRGKVGRRAFELHQAFKFQFVARWDDNWQITVGAVRDWVRAQAKDETR